MENDLNDTISLVVHAYEWTHQDAVGEEDDHMTINCWALDRDSNANLVRFNDFPAFCYLELPTFVRNRKYTWNKMSARAFMEEMSYKLNPYKYTFGEQSKLYYYRCGAKYPMICMQFKTYKEMQSAYWLFQKPINTQGWGWITCKVWESQISPVRKLLTIQQTRYSQWFTVQARLVKPEDAISTLKREYIANWSTLTPISSSVSKNWETNPGVLAIDIECYSDNHRAMPDKYNSKHVAYMLSCIYQRYRKPETRKRYGIIIGDCNDIPQDKLSNCQIIRVNTEYELIEVFGKLVRDTDPEILAGYNILGFDYPYLDHRVKRLLKEWPHMGRLTDSPTTMTSKSWSSSAYGYQVINQMNVAGRISIDLLPIIRRDYKLDKYDLNTVCQKFIGKTKHDVSAVQMFQYYEETKKCKANVDKMKASGSYENVSLAQKELDNALAQTTLVMGYCIQDSELVIELMEKLNIWVGLIELSSIVGVTIVELFTRGQQIRCVSQLYDLAARSGYIIDVRDYVPTKFKGGAVFPTIPDLHDNVICLDFSSLYPSIIMAYNICYTTLVPPELENVVPDEDCNVLEFDQVDEENEDEEDDENEENENGESKHKTPKATTHYRYKFYNKNAGILPQLVKALVTERRAVNREKATEARNLECLEKIDETYLAFNAYIKGEAIVGDVNKLVSLMKELAAKDAPVDKIISVKRSLLVSRVFQERVESPSNDLQSLQQELFDLKDKHDELAAKIISLGNERDARLATISEKRLLVVVLDKRQLALKVSANSFFGFLGTGENGKLPLMEGAISVTGKGRYLIGKVTEFVETKYGGRQVAGDTDSVMFTLPFITDSKQCEYWGNRLAQEISGIKPGEKDVDGVIHPNGRPGLFPPPLAMEFEKAMRLLCFKKKKYASFLIEDDGSFKTMDIYDKYGNIIGTENELLLRGIILVRRDNCKYIRKLYKKIMIMALEKKGLADAVDVLIDSIIELKEGKIAPSELVVIKSLGSNYKSDTAVMKVFANNLRNAGKIVTPGDRLDYVVVVNPNQTGKRILGNDMRLLEQYMEGLETGNPELIDYDYYINNLMKNSIEQLFAIGFGKDIKHLEHICYVNGKTRVGLDRIVTLLIKMQQHGVEIVKLKSIVRNSLQKRSAWEKAKAESGHSVNIVIEQ